MVGFRVDWVEEEEGFFCAGQRWESVARWGGVVVSAWREPHALQLMMFGSCGEVPV